MQPTSQPGQPLPQAIPQSASTTPTQTTQGADTPAQVAQSFQTPALTWNAHYPATTTTTTTTTDITATTTTTSADASNSSRGVAAHPATGSLAQVPAPWLQNVQEGDIRGDECFRARYGDEVSLLDDEGRINTRFTRNTANCSLHFRANAERLAALMMVRNESVAAVQGARLALQEAQTALDDEQEKYSLAKSAAERMYGAADEPILLGHEKVLAKAQRSVESARRELDALTQELREVRRRLRDEHGHVAARVAQTDAEVRLAIEHENDAFARAFMNVPGPVVFFGPRPSVYALSAVVFGGMSVVANARHVHASELLQAFDLSTPAGRLMEAVLGAVGYDPGALGAWPAPDVPMMAALGSGARDLVVGLFVGIFLADLLIQSGWLDI